MLDWAIGIGFAVGFVYAWHKDRQKWKCPDCGKYVKNDSSWYVIDPKNDRNRYLTCKTSKCDYTWHQRMHYKSLRGLWMTIKTPYGSEYID